MSNRNYTSRQALAGAAGLTVSLVVRGSAVEKKRHRFAVVGRGPMGSAAARYLAQAGEDVVVVGPEESEDWNQHEGAFASHYDAGRQFELASSKKALVRLAKDSLRGFQEVEKATGILFFRRHPNLRVGPAGFSDDHYYNWDGIDAVGRDLGVETVHLDDQRLSGTFPQFRFESGSRGLVEPNGGVINPRRMVKAQLRAAQANGATVISDEVVALNRRSGEIEVVLKNQKSISADQVLIATGPLPTPQSSWSVAWRCTCTVSQRYSSKFRASRAQIFPPLLAALVARKNRRSASRCRRFSIQMGSGTSKAPQPVRWTLRSPGTVPLVHGFAEGVLRMTRSLWPGCSASFCRVSNRERPTPFPAWFPTRPRATPTSTESTSVWASRSVETRGV